MQAGMSRDSPRRFAGTLYAVARREPERSILHVPGGEYKQFMYNRTARERSSISASMLTSLLRQLDYTVPAYAATPKGAHVAQKPDEKHSAAKLWSGKRINVNALARRDIWRPR